ncbi:flagellin N-terminal helical domain-containing protein [Marinobacter nauticus]|uniref:Flagellin n=1 Tax=Marinobacter nauticus TaxID=2743 RepID=A0A833JPL9_MARNT|nr:flagellin [Marinobacter nauticus]KAE8543925.1 Flagellin protein FlaA [Marinobacter nauticus]
MPQVINTNIASLNAQRNLNASQGQANTALERLSSGLRINSAKDDAAGLAISERFQSQISGLNQAQRNANDGISLAQTAEGAMDEITNNLQRIRELAVQSANATNSISDRQALDQEVQQRIQEINRIASQTSFNGLKVLDGTFNTQTFQVGANTGETIDVSGLDSRGSQIGATLASTDGFATDTINQNKSAALDISSDFAFSATPPTTNIEGSISVNGEVLDLTAADYDTTAELAAAINTQISGNAALSGISMISDGTELVLRNTTGEAVEAKFNLVVTDTTTAEISYAGSDTITSGNQQNDILDISSADFTKGGTLNVGGTFIDIEATGTLDTAGESIATEIQNAIGVDGVTVAYNPTDNDFDITNGSGADFTTPEVSITPYGNQEKLNSTLTVEAYEPKSLVESFSDGESYDFNININGEPYEFKGLTSLNDLVSQVNAKSNETGIEANLNANNNEVYFSSQFGEPFTIEVLADLDGDSNFNAATETLQSVVATIETDTVSMNDIDISTSKGADLAMIAVDYAIDTINGYRAELGAVQNRFESTIANLATTSENLSASNSRIRDADFAAESAELARTQVLQQAGLSVLAQANARPQQVLQLLQG